MHAAQPRRHTLDGKDTASRSRDAEAPGLYCKHPLSNPRAQGMPGAWCARSRAWWVVNTRVSHHGHTGNTRHSPRNGFNGFLRALLGDRALLSPSPTISRQLDASVEASGPHDFAVRKNALSSEAPPASTASRPASVTIATRPSVGRDAADVNLIWVRCERKYF